MTGRDHGPGDVGADEHDRGRTRIQAVVSRTDREAARILVVTARGCVGCMHPAPRPADQDDILTGSYGEDDRKSYDAKHNDLRLT